MGTVRQSAVPYLHMNNATTNIMQGGILGLAEKGKEIYIDIAIIMRSGDAKKQEMTHKRGCLQGFIITANCHHKIKWKHKCWRLCHCWRELSAVALAKVTGQAALQKCLQHNRTWQSLWGIAWWITVIHRATSKTVRLTHLHDDVDCLAQDCRWHAVTTLARTKPTLFQYFRIAAAAQSCAICSARPYGLWCSEASGAYAGGLCTW